MLPERIEGGRSIDGNSIYQDISSAPYARGLNVLIFCPQSGARPRRRRLYRLSVVRA